MNALNETQLQELLRTQPQWKLHDGKLVRNWTFQDFLQAMAFVNRIADLAEQAGHHPDIDIRYNRVTLGLVTHDAGGITQRDAEMAAAISQMFL